MSRICTPPDWQQLRIRDILTLIYGKGQAEINDGVGNFPIIGTGGIVGHTKTPLFDKPSVIIGRKGTINKPQFSDIPFWAIDTVFYTDVSSSHDAKFLYYKFCLIDWKSYNEASGVPSLNANTINNMWLDVPPLPEQQAIAEVLSDVDALIAAQEELIAKKRLIKQGVMQELLTGKRRLPGFNREWLTSSLSEIGEISGSGVDKKIREGESFVKLLNFMDVFNKDFIYAEDITQIVSAPTKKIYLCDIRKGDIFFTPSSEMPYDIAISALAMEDIPNAVYSYHIVRLRFNKPQDWDLIFRAYAFKNRYFLDQAEKKCAGSGQRYVISLPGFNSLKIIYPQDIKEQHAISEILFDIDQELLNLELEINKLKEIKQGMMQELLTGKTRLV